jgi:transposase
MRAILSELAELREELKELRARLNLGSHNSHKPPNSDGLTKTARLREKGPRNPGAQPGHKGRRLGMFSSPDEVVEISAGDCPSCGAGSLLEPAGVRRRQLVDIPAPKAFVAEYRSEQCRCLGCGALFGGAFPAGVTQPVQYGPRIKALAVYHNCFKLIPYRRVSGLQVYPVPAQDKVYVALRNPAARMKSLELYDASGRLLQRMDDLRGQTATVGVADLPEGIYFLKLTTDKGVQTQRLVKE